jgi:hypothetical protein
LGFGMAGAAAEAETGACDRVGLKRLREVTIV